MRLTARAPATVANLGPGFDCFGLALDLMNEVTVDTDAAPGVTWEGEGAEELPTDGSDVVSRAMDHVAARSGRELPSFALHGLNRIPLERGLGSSAAAAVAGVLLASALLEDRGAHDPHTTFSLATELEGHPDNAAAAVYGGLALAVGKRPPVRLEPHPDLGPVLLIPDDVRLSTDDARRALPEVVSRDDAVFNVGHAALALVALTRDPSLLFDALEDRLHQRVRLDLVPEMRKVFDLLRGAGFPVCVSGAGPTLLAFEREGRAVPDPGPGWLILRVPPSMAGAEVVQGD